MSPPSLDDDEQVRAFLADPLLAVIGTLRRELVGVSTDGAREHIDRLAVRYLGTSYTGPHQERLIIRLVPRRVSAQITRPRAAGPDRETTR
jgi:hypothetical protein